MKRKVMLSEGIYVGIVHQVWPAYSEACLHTTLQSVMNTKRSMHGFWHCHENELNKMIQMIPHNLYLGECQVDFPLLWIKAYPG